MYLMLQHWAMLEELSLQQESEVLQVIIGELVQELMGQSE